MYIGPSRNLNKFHCMSQRCFQMGHKCVSCRGVLCDTILDWEDALPDDQLEMSEKFSRAAELAIVIGSSLQVSF